jgi:hypothetical protein
MSNIGVKKQLVVHKKQNGMKDARLAKGQHPQTGRNVDDPQELARLRAEWETKKPKPKVRPPRE